MRYKDMLRISESSAYIIFRSSLYIKTFGSQLRPEDQQIGYASVTKYRYWWMVHFALKGYVAVCFVYVVVMACIERLCCCVFCLCSSPPGLQRTTWHLLKGYVAVCFVYVVVLLVSEEPHGMCPTRQPRWTSSVTVWHSDSRYLTTPTPNSCWLSPPTESGKNCTSVRNRSVLNLSSFSHSLKWLILSSKKNFSCCKKQVLVSSHCQFVLYLIA